MEQKYKKGDKVIVHHPGTEGTLASDTHASWNSYMNQCHGKNGVIKGLHHYGDGKHYRIYCDDCDYKTCRWIFHQDWLVPNEPVLEVYFRREKLYKKIDLG